MIAVAALRISPVKALAAVPRDRVMLEHDGVAEDRRLFLLRADGSVATLRQFPRLALVRPDLDLPAGKLAVAFPDGAVATGTLDPVDGPVRSRLFGKDRVGRVVPGEVAAALSAYAGEPLELVLADRTGIGWDEGPVSLLGRASAEAVTAPDGREGTARFRMLVDVDGTEAFEEDGWVGRRVTLGQAVLRVSKPLGRCLVVDRSPVTGEHDWRGLKTITAARGRPDLGVIAEVEQPGAIAVGDVLRIS